MRTRLLYFVCLVLLVFGACNTPETQLPASTSFEELSEQGRSLCRKGKYMEGMKLLQEANDVLSAMPADSINPDGAVMFLGNLSNLYTRIGLFEEAKQLNSRAIAFAEDKAPSRLPDLWGMRSIIYNLSNQPDSVVICLRRAKELCERIDEDGFRKRAVEKQIENLAWFYIENPDFSPDSIPVAKATLERIIAEHSEEGKLTYTDAATNRFLIGRADVLLGDYKRGLELMEQSLELFREQGDTESVEWALQLLAQSYAAAGDRKLFDIYTEAAALHDTIFHRRQNDLFLAMDFKYRTSQLKHDKSILESSLHTKQQRIVFVSVIAALLVVGLTVFSLMRIRYNKRQLMLIQQNLDNLISERIALNARIEELKHTVSDNIDENKRQEILSTILLEKEDELRFRKDFNNLHPGFIDRLRREFPNLTVGNELLCMLIALNRRNEEIALALGISRDSLATSRSRLRSRLNLSKETDLDKFIQSRI